MSDHFPIHFHLFSFFSSVSFPCQLSVLDALFVDAFGHPRHLWRAQSSWNAGADRWHWKRRRRRRRYQGHVRKQVGPRASCVMTFYWQRVDLSNRFIRPIYCQRLNTMDKIKEPCVINHRVGLSNLRTLIAIFDNLSK